MLTMQRRKIIESILENERQAERASSKDRNIMQRLVKESMELERQLREVEAKINCVKRKYREMRRNSNKYQIRG